MTYMDKLQNEQVEKLANDLLVTQVFLFLTILLLVIYIFSNIRNGHNKS
jgi:hypothetical protein